MGLLGCIVDVLKDGGDARRTIAAKFDGSSVDVMEGGYCVCNDY